MTASFGRAALVHGVRRLRWNGVGGRFGVTRLTKFPFTSDKKALVASYLRVLDRDFDRVVVSHGAAAATSNSRRPSPISLAFRDARRHPKSFVQARL